MDKIYCSNCYAEVTQNLKSCPVCGASLKPTTTVPKPTYTYHFTPTKQLEGIKKLKNGALVLGLVLIGVGLVLYFLAYQISITVIGLGISTVLIGLILFKTSEIPNINWRSYIIDLNCEGGKLYLIGAVSAFSGAGLGLTLLATRNVGPIGLFISVVLFLGGFTLVVVGGIMAWADRISKWRSEQKSPIASAAPTVPELPYCTPFVIAIFGIATSIGFVLKKYTSSFSINSLKEYAEGA